MHLPILPFLLSLISDKGCGGMKLSITEFKGIINAVKDKMLENKEYLIELDSAMGDGDLGLTMSRGFEAASQVMTDFTGADIGKALFQAGIAMNNAASSTMGTLMATAIMRAGKAASGKDHVEPAEIVEMGEAAAQGIMDRGKAKVGDKTILDSFVPAVEALKEGVAKGISLQEVFDAACQAAKNGVEKTKEMVSQHGRAHYYGEKSKGKQDPGATVALLIFEAVKDYLIEK